MAKGNDGSAARRRTIRKLIIAASIALGLTFVIVSYGGTGGNVQNYKEYDGYEEGHHYHDIGGQNRRWPRGFQHQREGRRATSRGDDESSTSTSGGHDNHHGFERYKEATNFKKGAPRFGRWIFGARDDDGGNGGGFSKQRKNIEEGGDDFSIDMGVLDGKVAAQFRKELINSHRNTYEAERVLDGILDASIHLVDIAKTYKLKYSTDGSYQGVLAEFCKLEWSLYENDPAKYPMFRFVVLNSPDCLENKTTFDLRKLAYLTRWHDQQIAKSASNEGPKVLNITAVAFHESRCGSTLVANSMIAMDPIKHRTYSESAPTIKAYLVCGNDDYELCSQNQAAAMLKDTMYLMSRSNDHREERAFFKFQSALSRHISTFQMAFPEVPWMYIYREPVQVVMSHYKDDPTMRRAICTKFRRRPSKDMYSIAERHGLNGPQDLTGIEYCAAHIAELTEAAVESLNDKAIPVAYHQLPNVLWEKIMPKIFGRPLEQFEIDNLQDISKSYSKGGTHADRKGEFKDDSNQKEKHAPPHVRDAATKFLQKSYDALTGFEPELLLESS